METFSAGPSEYCGIEHGVLVPEGDVSPDDPREQLHRSRLKLAATPGVPMGLLQQLAFDYSLKLDRWIQRASPFCSPGPAENLGGTRQFRSALINADLITSSTGLR